MQDEWREKREAMERGDWLPEGWAFVDDSHDRVPRDSLGAWDEKHNILVWVRPPPWTCWGCGTSKRMSSCGCVDFLDEATQAEMRDKWCHAQRDGAIMKVHGVGAPKVVFDMVWTRWLKKLWSRA